MLVSLDLDGQYRDMSCEIPKKITVQFEFTLVRHAGEVNSVLRVLWIRPKIDDRNEYFKVGYLIVVFFE